QVVLKIASPGVADFYQGTELWTYALVDPDNRGPVDFALRQRLLESLQQRWATSIVNRPSPAAEQTTADAPPTSDNGQQATEKSSDFIAELLAQRRDGLIKLFVTWRSLELRRDHWPVFLRGDYIPLEVHGPRAEHVVALARQYEGRLIIAVVPRLTVELTGFGGPPPVRDVWRGRTGPLPIP